MLALSASFVVFSGGRTRCSPSAAPPQVLDRTTDMLEAVYSLPNVVVSPRSATQLRVVFPIKHSLDVHARARDKVAVAGPSASGRRPPC